MAAFATKTIEEVTDVLIDYRGKTPTKTTSGVKLITAKVIKNGYILDGNHEYIAEDYYDEWMRRGLPQQWDILITTEAPLGEVAQLRSSEKVALAQRVILLRGNPEVIDQRYYFQALKSPFVQGELKARSSGTTVLGIKQSELWHVRIPYYPLPTQRRIASILSAYDDLIENNTRRLRILEQMAQTIYRDRFVEFRAPGVKLRKATPEEQKVTGKDRFPVGWEILPLEDVCTRITDGSHWSPLTVDQGYPMASVKDMTTWDIDVDGCRRITEEDYQKLVANDCKPLKGDVLVAKDGSYLKHIFTVDKERELVVLSSIAILRPNQRILSDVLSMYLLDPSVKSRMTGYVSGVAIPRIVLKDFRKFPVLVAPIDVQQQFIDIVGPMLAMCRVLVVKNANLRQTRDLLLPRLVGGEIEAPISQ